MTLPASGSITAGQVNTELGRSATANIHFNDSEVRQLAGVPSGAISMSNLRGKTWQVVATISGNVNHAVAQNYFSSGDWSSSIPKKLVINAGVYVGSTSYATPALRSGTGRGGTLLIQNYGYIRGEGGPASGGGGYNGGTAFYAEQSGITFQNMSGAQLYGGGGGGGRGGNGGGGYYNTTNYSGQFYQTNPTKRWFQSSDGYGTTTITAHWDGTLVASWSGPDASAPGALGGPGGYTYYKGAGAAGLASYIYRSWVTTTYTSGGAGGNGGRGQGHNGSAAGGAGGAAGGTNAGAGGTGGSGAGFGGNGATGNTGASGNNGGGAGGSGGGLAGYYILNIGYVSFSNSGSIAGRT